MLALPTVDYYIQAQAAAKTIQHILTDELKLAPPAEYLMFEHQGFTWLLAVMDPQNLGGKIVRYASEDVRHQIGTALNGLPVAISNHNGLRYAVLLSPKPRLKRKVLFEKMPGAADTFEIGADLTGPVALHPDRVINMIVAGSQGSGKSNLMRLLAHTARHHGWDLYLADPMQHTFSPEVWGGLVPHPVAGSRREVLEMVQRILAEIGRRAALFREQAGGELPPENLDDYNAHTTRPLRKMLFAMDEANTLLPDRGILESVADAARLGRKWGVMIVLAGHDWHKEQIPAMLSGMFPTRLCLRVADEYIGTTVLGLRRWGRLAAQIRQTGRAILLYGGEYRRIQTCLMEPEREREWITEAIRSTQALTAEEISLVRVAVDDLDGDFAVGKLVDVTGMTNHRVRELARTWELRGWLTPPADAVSARRVTDELRRLAGIPDSPKKADFAQGAQGRTGTAQGAQGVA